MNKVNVVQLVFLIFALTRSTLIRSQSIVLDVLVHQEDYGDISGGNGEWVGNKGESKRLELINIDVDTIPSGVGLEYQCHIEDSGTTSWISQGNNCGIGGLSLRLEGFAARLTGANAADYSIVYRCHIEGSGDSGYFNDGGYCGTTGESKRIESVWIQIVNN